MDLLSRKKFLHSLIDSMESGGCYADILYINNTSLAVNKDKTTIDVSRDADEGVKLRVFDGKRFHELGLSGWNETSIKKSALSLGKIKNVAKISLDIPTQELDANYTALGKIDPSTIPIKTKLADINTLHKAAFAKDFANLRLHYDETHEEKIFVSQNRKLSQKISGCHIALMSFVKSVEGDIRLHYESFFDHGYERMNIKKSSLAHLISFSKKIAKAKKLTPGKYHCLLSPHLSGLLAHESFGHGMEADTLYKGRGKALEFLGKKLCGKDVSIADGPMQPGKHGFFFFDDEGCLATKTLMMDEGVVNLPLTDMFNAAKLKVPRSSNARAESFDRKSYARMTNTFFEPGTSTRAKMQQKIKDGLLLHTASGGMEDPKGWGIQIQGVVAEQIKNGKLTGELFYEIGMSGYLPTMLSNIQEVSKEFEIPGTGICGKGHKDWVRVAEGGPYLLIKDVVLS